MRLPSAGETYKNTAFIAPPYKNIFGTPFHQQQFSLPIYYSFADCTRSSEIQLVLNIDANSLMKGV